MKTIKRKPIAAHADRGLEFEGEEGQVTNLFHFPNIATKTRLHYESVLKVCRLGGYKPNFVFYKHENDLQNRNLEKTTSWLYIVHQWQGAAQPGIWFWKSCNRLDNLICENIWVALKRADWV